MSSLVRRIQRSQPHKALQRSNMYWNKFTRTVICGRTAYMGRGAQLGVKNPGDKSLLARVARDKKWGRA